MMFMTAKVDKKKILIALAAVAAVIVLLVLLFSGGSEPAQPTASGQLSANANDGRVAFLEGHGWTVSNAPVESGQVRIPQPGNQVFDRYNQLQLSQGYDLSSFAGKTALRYVYKVNNYPDATDPVYATLLVYDGQIIGGDITDTSAKGAVRGFAREEATPAPEESQPQ